MGERMRTPQDWANWRETKPQLPPGPEERVAGYGIMGIPFESGQILGLRRWTASSAGEAFTSIWHRNPDGMWTFYEDGPRSVACSRWFGDRASQSHHAQIDLSWTTPQTLRISVDEVGIDWTVELRSTLITRLMSAVGGHLPQRLWNSPTMLSAMGFMATTMLGVGKVGLAGKTTNHQDFRANPLRIWKVGTSRAFIGGDPLGQPNPLPKQARLGDFLIPQRGIFAIGQVFLTPI